MRPLSAPSGPLLHTRRACPTHTSAPPDPTGLTVAQDPLSHQPSRPHQHGTSPTPLVPVPRLGTPPHRESDRPRPRALPRFVSRCFERCFRSYFSEIDGKIETGMWTCDQKSLQHASGVPHERPVLQKVHSPRILLKNEHTRCSAEHTRCSAEHLAKRECTFWSPDACCKLF